jgi:hypothetical protein
LLQNKCFFFIIISNSAKRIAFHFRREEIGIGDKGRRTHYLPVVDTNRMRRNETFLYREGKKKDRNSLVQDKKATFKIGYAQHITVNRDKSRLIKYLYMYIG